MFPYSPSRQLKSSEEQLKAGAVGNKLQNFFCPRVSLSFSLVFQFSFPFGSFPLKRVKAFRGEKSHFGVGDAAAWPKLCLLHFLSLSHPLLLCPAAVAAPKKEGRNCFRTFKGAQVAGLESLFSQRTLAARIFF